MKVIMFLIIAYLLGSIPTGLWIGKYFYGKNLRDYGSGNMGTTNTFRVLGPKAGSVTFIIDMLKGTLATVLPMIFGVSGVTPLLFGFFAILGHTFPIFAGFKGGKAVATSAGILLGLAPLFLLYLLIIFTVVLYLSSMISLASVTAAAAAIISALIFPAFHFLIPFYDWLFTGIIILIAGIIIVRHKDNMIRIKEKNENLVPWGLNLTHQKKKAE
ncbi:glycerol-3-phosphate 1-O-acyltransferase PlsY [Streptococcus ratti]|nr:glycerol-3-phosphate 1-O-acyltransferase PlsY [Streptococcus ratti]EMP70153.1 glycerol-3-phosphate acyltransferase PlsY [Streptococcus ratti FA-1 = DSM 20564]QEY07865.1 glycerol-3-phosphate 1-O-acyltransferase PlsY [Streptococcus ratti]VEI60334.1 putative glycerol-3-phosphate acyltransferase PlsY [Streptococcus mutans]